MSFLSWLTGASPNATSGRVASGKRQAAWEKSLIHGGSPPFVQQRLRAAAKGQAPWISSMTPAELLVSRRHGVRAIGIVAGTCWFRYAPLLITSQNGWSQSQVEGWETALSRLQAEAGEAGANAVVDVQMRQRAGDAESHEYTLIGTAIRLESLPPSPAPLVVSFGMLEFVRLLEAGIAPITMAVEAASSTICCYNTSGIYQYGTSPPSSSGMDRYDDIIGYRDTLSQPSQYPQSPYPQQQYPLPLKPRKRTSPFETCSFNNQVSKGDGPFAGI